MEIGQNMVKCLFCGTIYVDDFKNKEEEILIVNAYEKLRNYDFSSAQKAFEKILLLYPKSYEAYFGLLQAKHKVVFFAKESSKTPAFFDEILSFLNDKDFLNAVELAPSEVGESFKEQANLVEKIKKEYEEKAKDLPPYDILLNGDEKSKTYQEVLKKLENFSLFLPNSVPKVDVDEAYLYQAVKTSKVEIFVVEKEEDLTNLSFKSLTDRFIYRIKTKERFPSSFIVVCNDNNVSVEEIKKAFPHLQRLYATSDTAYLENLSVFAKTAVERNYNESVSLEKKTIEKIEPIENVNISVVEPTELGQYKIENMPLSDKNKTKWIFYSIKNGDFQTAEKLLSEEENKTGELYYASLLCDLKIKDDEEFFKDLDHFKNKEALENIIKLSSSDFADQFVNNWEELIIKTNDVDVYLKYFDFLSSYNNSSRQKFIDSAINIALETNNNELIDKIEKSFSDTEALINFYFQLAQKTGDDKFYNKILSLNSGHAGSLFALFLKKFSTTENKLTYRNSKDLENVLKYCDKKQRSAFLINICDLVLNVAFYDIKATEEQLDFYLSYIDEEFLQNALIKIATFLQSEGFFSLAEKYLVLAIKNDKQNASLYWQLIQIKTHSKNESELITSSVKISEMEDWATVLSYASDEQTEKYAKIVSSANLTTAQKKFRPETLDKLILTEKLNEFLIRNRKILKDSSELVANYYLKQLTAFDGYFEKIDDANTFEQFFEVEERIFERLEVMDLTLDTSVNLARLARKKENLEQIDKEADRRERKYLSTIEVAERERKTKLILFLTLNVLPFFIVSLLLFLTVIFPSDMFLAINQTALMVTVVLLFAVGAGNFVFNYIKKEGKKSYRISRVVLFVVGAVDLLLMLFAFYAFPPNISISSANEFNKILHNTTNITINLENDIDLKNIEWTELNTNAKILGNGHSLNNLHFKDDENVALFGNFGGEINDLIINISGEYGDVSRFAGVALNLYGKLNNVSVNGEISLSTNENAVVGGMVAEANGGSITASEVNLQLNLTSSSNEKIGGFVGSAGEGFERISESRTSFFQISTNLMKNACLGGLIGENINTNINECYSDVNFNIESTSSSTIGGIVGLNRAQIENAYSVGFLTIQENEESEVGGIVGRNFRRYEGIRKTYSSINISADGESVGYLVGKLEEGIVSDSFAVGENFPLVAQKHGNSGLAQQNNCDLLNSPNNFKNTYDFSKDVWHIKNGTLPMLKCFVTM